MYRTDGNQIVFSGWEQGIDASPYEGIADMRNVDIITTPGEASVAFANAAVTMPPVFNAVAYTAQNTGDTITLASVAGLYEGCAVVLASNTATGLSDGVVYYVRNIVGLTFQVSLKPAGPLVTISADGTGTLTTYQYGNQRGLDNNGSPVSYWEAPEIGGVLLVDCSNYAWFWAQTTGNIVAKNHIIFLGNITGIGAASINKTGICYWQDYVLLVQQQSWVNAISWERFTSTFDSTFLDTSITYPEVYTITCNGAATSDMMLRGVEIIPADYSGEKPVVLTSGYAADATSSTTVVSGSFTVEAGDTVVAFAFTHNNQSVSGATFNGNAMTSIEVENDTTPWNYGYGSLYYTAGSDMTGTVTATFSGAVTNKFIYVYVVRNGTSFFAMRDRYENNSASISQNYYRTHPDVLNLMLLIDNSGDTGINFGDTITTLSNAQQAGGTAYTNLTGYYSNYWDSSETLKKNVPITVGENNIVYWGNGYQYLASLSVAPGQQFNPFQSTSVTTSTSGGGGGLTTITANRFSYNLNSAALDLPADERIESVAMAGGTLFLGATSNKVYPWDTISPSFNFPVVLPEFSTPNLIPANNILYALGGNLGRVYLTNNSSASIFKELSDSVTAVEKPHFFFWDGNVGNGELYFSFQAYENGSTDPSEMTGGAWAINANTGALRLVQRPTQGYDVLTRMVCPVGHGNTQSTLRPAGQGLLIGYTKDSDHYLEFSTSSPYTNYESYIETEIVPVGTFFSQQTFEHIEYKLGAPMVTGESIRVSQRSNLNTTYTVIAEFTTTGLISDQASINWENVQWCQFKIELKSTATTPSYVRLREFRLR